MESSPHIELFYAYAIQSCTEINKLLIALEENRETKASIDALFINFRVLKGYALGLEFKSVASMAHVLEDVFRVISEGKLKLNLLILTEIKNGMSTLEKLIESIKSEEKAAFLVCKARLGSILSEL
tara:strand:- start:2530 stop:2907 length:378 start_codon:yes stop_codon:yes gene_type:complete